MKKLLYITAVMLFATSCAEDFLDTRNLYQQSLETFYQTPADIAAAMAGMYNALYVAGPHSEEHITANLLDDLMLGGGGPDDKSAKNVDKFEDPEEDTYKDLWVETYNGVFRANAIIEAVSVIDYSSFFNTAQEAVDFKNQTLGEAHFMRGFFMFRAAKFFGGMPLILATDATRNVPRATFSETFGQIAADLKIASETMPAIPANQIPISRYGHANKWIADAYIARVFLFYTGYMTNIEDTPTDVITLPGGGTLTRAAVITILENTISQSGYSLVPDFRNLWPYSYVNQSAGAVVLPWAQTLGLRWAGQDGHHSVIGTGNPEVMFALRYSFGNWDWAKGQSYNNRVPLFFGIRENSMVPFGQGWGWGTVHPLLVSRWPANDLRKDASILPMGDATRGTAAYQGDKGDHETGFFNKKYTTLQHGGADGVRGMFYYIYDMVHGDPMQLWAAQDFYFMRFADVLLMHSELTQTATGINAVRARAQLAPVAYSLQNLKDERKFEFAFEGLRWFDLVRWGDVENSANNFFSNEVAVRNSGIPGLYSVTYRPETKGLLPIPESEIRLSGGILTQNPGW